MTVPSLGIRAVPAPCRFPSSFPTNAQQMGLLGRKERSSPPLCCRLLIWPSPGTVAMPGLQSGYPVAPFLENAMEREGNLRRATRLSPARCMHGLPRGPGWAFAHAAPVGSWAVPCRARGEGVPVSHARTAGQGEGCWGRAAPKPGSGATALRPPRGGRGPVKLALVSWRCY